MLGGLSTGGWLPDESQDPEDSSTGVSSKHILGMISEDSSGDAVLRMDKLLHLGWMKPHENTDWNTKEGVAGFSE